MISAPLSLVGTAAPRPAARPRPSGGRAAPLIGQILVARGALDPGDLARALALRGREDARLGEILLAHNMVAEAELTAALAEQWKARIIDLAAEPPDPRLIDALGAEECLRRRLVPWRRIGAATVIVTARPEAFERQAAELPAEFGPALMAVAPERDVLEALLALRSRRLVRRAETLAPEAESCRIWDGRRFSRLCLAGLLALAAAHLLAPAAAFAALTVVALLALMGNVALRLGALATGAHRRLAAALEGPLPSRPPAIARLPMVSILVPLYHETAIAERLLVRLARLSYPRELLDICLVTEDSDATTRATLSATRLPRWLRVVTVPEGTLRTKPRALNYALDFCRGSIVGVYDAEDAPAPDQIHRVVARFHERGPEVACLQGVLDYYNARSNWMARCFALEYAAWFRVVLPGLERMGLAIPLGGTTLFFRRAALEELGGWDAHNVTEDADLGIRLARHGFRAEMIDTVTEEEANCRPWPWVKQRSRWIKGYAMTWAVHMRDPRRLWRELGAWRFLGLQVFFAGTLAQFLLAPVLWSYWLFFLGLPHPLAGTLPGSAAAALVAVFAVSALVNIAVMLVGVSGPRHRHLMPWAVTLGAYFPLATLAAAKALAEMVTRPFYWDKTCHGVDDAAATPASAGGAAGPASAPARAPDRARPALARQIGEGP
jgi:glycosyltransferase involved in cell wall biosynthesis